MLRAARFVAAFGLEPTPELTAAITAMTHRLEIVSVERIRDELQRLLLVDDPTAGLWMLCETGLSDEFLPELNAMRLEQDPIHSHKDVLAHTIAVVRNTDPRLACPSRGTLPRHREAEDPLVRFGRCELPPSRGRRRPDDRGADARAALPVGAGRRGHDARVPPPPHPHLCDGLERQGGATVRPRRGPAPRRSEPPAALRLHDPQQAPRGRAGAQDGRAGGSDRASCASRRSSTRSVRPSTAVR